MLLFSLPLYGWAPQLLSLFQKDTAVIRIGASALRAQSLVLFTHGVVTCTILYLQALGNPIRGTVLASARQGIFFLPLIFILPMRWGLAGLEWTQPIADALTLLFAIPFVLFAWRRLKKETP
jgi:Na+-driven multidrug efflux pump